jgi:hypothetical protein
VKEFTQKLYGKNFARTSLLGIRPWEELTMHEQRVLMEDAQPVLEWLWGIFKMHGQPPSAYEMDEDYQREMQKLEEEGG